MTLFSRGVTVLMKRNTARARVRLRDNERRVVTILPADSGPGARSLCAEPAVRACQAAESQLRTRADKRMLVLVRGYLGGRHGFFAGLL